MTDEAAFLRAVIEAPDDDVPLHLTGSQIRANAFTYALAAEFPGVAFSLPAAGEYGQSDFRAAFRAYETGQAMRAALANRATPEARP